MTIRFGKHAGEHITAVPKDYLKYLLKWDKLKPDMRDAINGVLSGTYVSPVESPKRKPYEPPDIEDRLTVATRNAARRALSDAATEIDGLDIPSVHKSAVLNALLAVAGRLMS